MQYIYNPNVVFLMKKKWKFKLYLTEQLYTYYIQVSVRSAVCPASEMLIIYHEIVY